MRKETMLQQVMTAPGVIEFREIPVPQPEKGQVLVKIHRIGVCGSDIHVYHGKHPFTSYPVTQGHEVSGSIEALGEGVTGLSVGQKVTIEPQVTCGHCHPCTHGKYNLCEELKVMGFQTTGTASEYFAVDASKVTPLPDSMTFDEGAMIEPAETAKALGSRRVMITDVSNTRLQKALECGVDRAVNTKEEDFAAAFVGFFGPDKADVIYDCAGNDITMGQAIANARKGSTIILVAVYAGMAHVDLAVLNDHELDLNTTMMYRHEDYVTAIELVEQKKIALVPLMSSHFAFRDYLQAYQYIDENRESTMKVLIDVDR